MIALVLGLSASVVWGLADFLGGLQSRRISLLAVVLVSQLAGLAGMPVIVGLAGGAPPGVAGLAPAAVAGLVSAAAVALFYRALAVGTMTVIAPTVAALCALAAGPSRLSGIAHLRGHETDRLAALVAEINRLGGDAEETADGLIIRPAPLHGGVVHSYADHRMATAGAILGLGSDLQWPNRHPGREALLEALRHRQRRDSASARTVGW